MAMLLFKDQTVTVRVTYNVISEMIRLNDSKDTQGVMELSVSDPMGWMRDILYCSLRIYNPTVIGNMTKWQVGDELFKLKSEEITQFMKDLMGDLIQVLNPESSNKEVASEKK